MNIKWIIYCWVHCIYKKSSAITNEEMRVHIVKAKQLSPWNRYLMLYYMFPSTGVLTSGDNFFLYPTILSTRSVRQYNDWSLCVAVHCWRGWGGDGWTAGLHSQQTKYALTEVFNLKCIQQNNVCVRILGFTSVSSWWKLISQNSVYYSLPVYNLTSKRLFVCSMKFTECESYATRCSSWGARWCKYAVREVYKVHSQHQTNRTVTNTRASQARSPRERSGLHGYPWGALMIERWRLLQRGEWQTVAT